MQSCFYFFSNNCHIIYGTCAGRPTTSFMVPISPLWIWSKFSTREKVTSLHYFFRLSLSLKQTTGLRSARYMFPFNSESSHFVSVWKQIRKMRQHFWFFHLICSCRIKGFSVHGPTLLSVLGIHLRAFTILVWFLSCNWLYAHCFLWTYNCVLD